MDDGEAITAGRGLVALLKFAEGIEPLIRKSSEAQGVIDGLEAQMAAKQAALAKLAAVEQSEQARAAGYRRAADAAIAKMDEEKSAKERALQKSKDDLVAAETAKAARIADLDRRIAEQEALIKAEEREYAEVVAKHEKFLKDIGAK